MKKFILTLSAFAAFATAHAASVTWNSGDLKSAVTSDIADITAYYFVISDGTYADYAANWTTEEIVAQYVNSNDGSLKSTPDYTGSTVSAPFGPTVVISDTFTVPGNDVYAVAVYVANSTFGGSYALASPTEYHDTGTDYESDQNYTSGLGTDAIAYSTSGGWTAVPEPTTIAFLALGLAAVGLKRKVA